jgi:hypothetical protein
MLDFAITRITAAESRSSPAWHEVCSADPDPEGLRNMVLAVPLAPHTERPSAQLEAGGADCPSAPPEDPLEELIEMRYQQYLAQRGLQELFESGASLES